MAANKTKRNWIIGITIIIIIAVIIYFAMPKTPGQPSYNGVNGADLSKLSPQDFATYNSLPNDAAKLDFLKILASQNKIPPVQNPNVVIPPTSTPPLVNNGSTGSTTTSIWDKIKSWFHNLGSIKAPNLDNQGNSTGTYTPSGTIDCFGCDAFNRHATGDMAGLPCDTDPSDC